MGQALPAGQVPDPVKDFDKSLLRNHLPVQAQTFPDIRQMGGNEKARGITGRQADGFQIIAYAALAVGPGHMNDLHIPVGFSQQPQIGLGDLRRVLG